MRSLVFLVLMSFSFISQAAEEYILLGQWSKHHNPKDYYNEKHNLIGYERNNYFVANFINSDGDNSWIAGYSQKFNYGMKLNYALVQGYERVNLFPIIVPSITLGKGKVKLDVNYLPFVVLTAGFRFQLN